MDQRLTVIAVGVADFARARRFSCNGLGSRESSASCELICLIDDVVMPRNACKRVCRALVMLKDKELEDPWKKHGNIPL